jgi:predicted transcriptional regulator
MRDATEDILEPASTVETVRRRIERADPEFVFNRARADCSRLEGRRHCSRNTRAQELEQRLEVGENHAKALRKTVLEREEQATELGRRMAEAAEQVKEEPRRLDVVIPELPIDEKIKIMATRSICQDHLTFGWALQGVTEHD